LEGRLDIGAAKGYTKRVVPARGVWRGPKGQIDRERHGVPSQVDKGLGTYAPVRKEYENSYKDRSETKQGEGRGAKIGSGGSSTGHGEGCSVTAEREPGAYGQLK